MSVSKYIQNKKYGATPDSDDDDDEYDLDYDDGFDDIYDDPVTGGADDAADEDDEEDTAEPPDEEDDEPIMPPTEPVELPAEPLFDVSTMPRGHNREIIVVAPEHRRTSNVLSLFEMTEIVSIRSTQIAHHSTTMLDDIAGLTDPIAIAKRELMMRRCPLVLRRRVGQKTVAGETQDYYEYWNPNEMQFAKAYEPAKNI